MHGDCYLLRMVLCLCFNLLLRTNDHSAVRTLDIEVATMHELSLLLLVLREPLRETLRVEQMIAFWHHSNHVFLDERL